jgi:hypothetical protein
VSQEITPTHRLILACAYVDQSREGLVRATDSIYRAGNPDVFSAAVQLREMADTLVGIETLLRQVAGL